MINYNFKNYKRISKAKARKLFADGMEIRITPCKVNIDHDRYGISFDISKELNADYDFNKLIDMCTYYNCNYELGYYLAYYIKK